MDTQRAHAGGLSPTVVEHALGAAQKLRLSADSTKSETFVRELLAGAGIEVGGNEPHDIHVHDPSFYTRVLRDGSLGFGESYMDGQWDSEALDETIAKVLLGRLEVAARRNPRLVAHALRAKVVNPQAVSRAFQVGEHHYDIGNELYERMLDPNMAYSCGYWRDGATTLEEAQTAKLDLVCRKLGLEPGMRLLELGCGWGSLAKHATANYGVSYCGLTVSKEQAVFAKDWTDGLPVEIRVEDYRAATGDYDAVVSIGFMEHVGNKNYRTYMEVVDRCLAPGGVSLVHTIAGNRSVDHVEPWFDKYIFPNGLLPTIGSLGAAMDDMFVCEDVENFGTDYDTTLMVWFENFEAAWPDLQRMNPTKYDERFHRMWTYYLKSSAATFRTRYTQLYQMVFTRPGTAQPNCRRW